MNKYIDADALILDLNDYALQESPNPNDDADIRLMHSEVCDAIVNCIRVAENMPAADVEPVRHGEWIEDDYGFFHCSRCGFEWDEPEYTSNYCPDCGAKNGRVVMADEE